MTIFHFSIPFPAFIFFCMVLSLPVLASEPGMVQLRELPVNSQVYVDGKPAGANKGLLILPPGRHEIQVETWKNAGVSLCRYHVQVTARQVQRLSIVLKPVQISELSSHRGEIIFIPGEIGEAGAPGDSGSAGSPPPAVNDFEGQRKRLAEAIEAIVTDLNSRIDNLRKHLARHEPRVYYYNPLLTVQPEQGGRGAWGPLGPEGITGSVFLIQDHRSMPLLESLQQPLGIADLEKKLAALEPRVKRLPGDVWRQRSVKLYTPKWRMEYERRHRKWLEAFHKADYAVPLWHPEIGDSGPMGSRGPDGFPPKDVSPIRLSPDGAGTLLRLLKEDPALKERLQRLESEIADLTGRLSEAERY